MSTPTRVIVVGVDFSTTGAHALREALLMASADAAADLHVAYVALGQLPQLRLDLPDGVHVVGPDEAEQRLMEYVRGELASARNAGVEVNDERVKCHVRVGTPADALCECAAEIDADLLIVGTHGRTGMKRLLLGSVAEAVVRQAHCQVLVVRPKDWAAPES